jgi:hypothetical protein
MSRPTATPAALVGICLMAVAACGSGSSGGTTSPARSTAGATVDGSATRNAPSATVGVVALGHSAITGRDSDPTRLQQDTLENSWATGTNPDVNSVYERLVALRPENKGHVANAGQDGSSMDALGDQVHTALAEVPTPLLVIIQISGNDWHCDGTDATHVPEYGAKLRSALNTITTASPHGHILVVGKLGSVDSLAAAVAKDPAAKADYTGTGMCDLFNPAGELVQANADKLSGILESYDAEQEQVCAAVPQCTTDRGAAATFVDDINDMAHTEWAAEHEDVHGQAREAQTMWPRVAAALNLD